MSEYVKTCKYCKQEIKMSDDSGKWNPYNKDGSAHDCRNREPLEPAAVAAAKGKQETTTHTLEMVQKKLESIGIIINVERLMKE